MAKRTVSVRLEEETVRKMDRVAELLHTGRGRLAAESLESMFGGQVGPIEMAQALATPDGVSALYRYMEDMVSAAVEDTESIRA